MTIKGVKSKEIMDGKIRDLNYPELEWKKYAHIHYKPDGTVIEIHFWENGMTGERVDFVFKDNEKESHES